MVGSLLDRITINPQVAHGKPTIRNLRYTVEGLLYFILHKKVQCKDQRIGVFDAPLRVSRSGTDAFFGLLANAVNSTDSIIPFRETRSGAEE